MKIANKSGGEFAPHPDGSFRAVCVDVTPLVKRDSQYGPKEEFRLVFETDAESTRADGSPQCVWSRLFTPSLSEKAAFRKFLRQWLGRDLTGAEEAEFDTEDLIGKPASIVIIHESSQDGSRTYANIAACTPSKGDHLAMSGTFVRKKDKESAGSEASVRTVAQPTNPIPVAEAVDGTKAGADWTKVKVHVGKFAGMELRDLQIEDITKLASNWLPTHESNKKPSADDKRLAAALKLAATATTVSDF
jgi:hypothetical protein